MTTFLVFDSAAKTHQLIEADNKKGARATACSKAGKFKFFIITKPKTSRQLKSWEKLIEKEQSLNNKQSEAANGRNTR